MQYNNLVNCLQSLLGILELDRQTSLYQDTVTICDYLSNAVYKIAVFAPFNHGKSTLLNALLGSKTLPIDLIPTTGAAISVGYGESLLTKITLQDGTEIEELGTKILKQYAILDDDRRMKSEVAEVKVFCDLPWLKTGVEFLDLPGTNDREAQNELVRDKLLSADLIIHVLDARKLMTLEERENLTTWLYNRGINTVIFVVNFLNLLTLEEQKEVQNRLRFVAESFRSNLPVGISNLYCVDALPALRARLKGDGSAAQTTGLTTFESALQQIASSEQNSEAKLSRVIKISETLLAQAIAKQQEIKQTIVAKQESKNKQVKVKQKAEQLIKQSFDRNVSEFQGWLYLPKLLTKYQPSLAIALQQAIFDQWLSEFQTAVINYQQSINKCVNQGCEFFQYKNPNLLTIDFPAPPIIQIPEYIEETIENQEVTSTFNIPKELNFMLKSRVGAVVLGGASYVVHKVSSKPSATANSTANNPTKISSQVYADAAEAYLKIFCDRANLLLTEYETLGEQYITFIPQLEADQGNIEDYQLKLLDSLITNFKDELSKFR